LEVNGVLDDNEEVLTLHKDTPVFDGQYSNQCYQDRIREAYAHFRSQSEEKEYFSEDEILLKRWSRLIFHLPYAFHAKRIFSEIFMKELQNADEWHTYLQESDLTMPRRENEDDAAFEKVYAQFLRSITKTTGYRNFVKEKMEKAQRASSLIGNMYACSIFMGLMSSLESDWKEGEDLTGAKFGFFGYGSGSKSKCFEADLQPQWKEVVANFNIFNRLEKRTAIDYATYENLHRGRQKTSIITPQDEFSIDRIGTEGVREGARYYKFTASVPVSA